MKKRIVIAFAVVFCAISVTYAIDGFSVSLLKRWGRGPEINQMIPENMGHPRFQVGKMIKYTIDNNAISQIDTLTDYICSRAIINITGTEIAYWRYNHKVNENNELVGTAAPCYLSVMNSDGSNVRDLIALDCPGQKSHLGWPASDGGRWVYYERNDSTIGDIYDRSTREIWRVNVDEPSRNELVVKYAGEGHIIRWSISKDGKRAAMQDDGGYGNSFHCFPPAEGDPLQCAPLKKKKDNYNIVGCNLNLTPSGVYAYGFKSAAHTEVAMYEWPIGGERYDQLDAGTGNFGNLSFHSDVLEWVKQTQNIEPQFYGGEYLQYPCNSDKWLLLQIGIWEYKGGMRMGTNQVLANWIDKIAFCTSNNPVVPITDDGSMIDNTIYYHSTAGDFWVKPPAGKEGTIELTTGEWVPVEGAGSHYANSSSIRPRSIDAGRPAHRSVPRLITRRKGIQDRPAGIYITTGTDSEVFDIRGTKRRR